MHLRRKYPVYYAQIFLPNIFILFICWLGLWIHHTEVSGRTTIVRVCLTAIIAEILATIIFIPDQLHMEAVIAWNSICLFMITLAFVEFIITHRHQLYENKLQKTFDEETQNNGDEEYVRSKVINTTRRRRVSRHSQVQPLDDGSTTDVCMELQPKKQTRNKVELVDFDFCVLFVVIFGI